MMNFDICLCCEIPAMKNYPQIHIRTWQSDLYDTYSKFYKRILKDEVFDLTDLDT